MGLFLGREDDITRAITPIIGECSVGVPMEDVIVNCKAGGFCLRTVSGPVAASTSLWVHPNFRRQGWSDRFEEAKMAICRLVGVELLIATVRKDNEAETAAITKHGWMFTHRLSEINVYHKRISQVQTLNKPLV